MTHYKEKAALGWGIIILSAAFLSSCNTLQGTTKGLESTASGVGQTVVGAAVGAGKDVQAVKSTSKHKMMENSNHEPAG